jgi:hypothetical protein
VFTMRLTKGAIRENHVVEFAEGRRIAWRPAEPGQEPPGHLWRWELEPAGAAALAAVLSAPGRFAGRTVAIVCSGGNISPAQLAELWPPEPG